ncbi:flagellar basal body P-ring formation chaperone FlgA [Alteromonas sp. a30]|uniref:flagellar basal body P-ring formation chaperone FlgA n=1 Tax=Alteromonas sp. a30 TaxID=2730917 RepID=UPI00228169C2|nr:flagellar basal body P-ring formation chaperone FlgA [Alteromonas sp. a30]MCY7294555.1 flagellar basal body P-ring formation protein FlgA [Alteromonas sp. a30]
MKNTSEILKRLKFPVFLLGISTSFVSVAQQNSAHHQVTEAAEQYVLSNISPGPDSTLTVKAKEIDQRIQVPHCPLPLETSSSGSFHQRNVTVKVNCPSNDWFIYLVVTVEEMQPVVVPSSALSPGSILTSANLEVVDIERSRLRGTTFRKEEDLIGARLKRRSRPGYPISPNMLCFVCKGDAVTIVAEVEGMQIKATGMAEQDGNIGDTILIRNKRSKKRISARVVSVNQVVVSI